MQSYWSALQFAPTNLPVFYRGMPQASHGMMNLTANHLNQHTITLMPVLMTYYIMLHITPLPQLSHANSLAAKPNMPTFIWIILLLSTYPVGLYLPTRYLPFHVDSLSALLHDISTGRKFQPTFTTFLGACD